MENTNNTNNPDYKQVIINELDTLRKSELANKNTFKARAYGKVIDNLKVHAGAIVSVADIDGVAGVGKSIKEKIIEIISTGVLNQAEALRHNPNTAALDALTKVYGIGAVKAKKLVEAGVNTIAKLRAAVAADPDTLHEKQRIGLKHYEDILERIPRNEMLAHETAIKALVSAVFPTATCAIVGSFRRKAADSGDIDVLIKGGGSSGSVSRNLTIRAIIREMEAGGYIVDALALGPKKFMGICRLMGVPGAKARRLDILLTPESEFAFSLLYFTGSDKFNIMMRNKALTLGWSLNEHGLTSISESTSGAPPPEMGSEEDIFNFLGIPFTEPENRASAVIV
jgi:DNA polymerase/3'-5' exonuclease PolX